MIDILSVPSIIMGNIIRPNNDPMQPNAPDFEDTVREARNTSTDDESYKELDPDGYSEHDPPNTDTETLNAW